MADVNPNNNIVKQNEMVELWYRLMGGEKFERVNLAKNSELKESTPAGTQEYVKEVNKKSIPLVYEKPITVKSDQDLHICFFHHFNMYDMKNPQKGVEDRTSFDAIKHSLSQKSKKDKSLVILSSAIGNEYDISNLMNASIDDKKILFWGLEPRLNKLIQYITIIAESGADEILLFNGRDEHRAKQKFNRDVLRDELLDKFNDVMLTFAVEKVNTISKVTKTRKVKIAYVPGVKKVLNIYKKTKDNAYFYDLSIHTNLKTTSKTIKGNEKAAENQHGGIASADYAFVASENIAGQKGNVVYVPGLARYMNTARNYVPAESVSGHNSYTLILGKENHKCELVDGSIFNTSPTYGLEKKIAEENTKFDLLCELCDEKYRNIRVSHSDYNDKLEYKKMYAGTVSKQNKSDSKSTEDEGKGGKE